MPAGPCDATSDPDAAPPLSTTFPAGPTLPTPRPAAPIIATVLPAGKSRTPLLLTLEDDELDELDELEEDELDSSDCELGEELLLLETDEADEGDDSEDGDEAEDRDEAEDADEIDDELTDDAELADDAEEPLLGDDSELAEETGEDELEDSELTDEDDGDDSEDADEAEDEETELEEDDDSLEAELALLDETLLDEDEDSELAEETEDELTDELEDDDSEDTDETEDELTEDEEDDDSLLTLLLLADDSDETDETELELTDEEDSELAEETLLLEDELSELTDEELTDETDELEDDEDSSSPAGTNPVMIGLCGCARARRAIGYLAGSGAAAALMIPPARRVSSWASIEASCGERPIHSTGLAKRITIRPRASSLETAKESSPSSVPLWGVRIPARCSSNFRIAAICLFMLCISHLDQNPHHGVHRRRGLAANSQRGDGTDHRLVAQRKLPGVLARRLHKLRIEHSHGRDRAFRRSGVAGCSRANGEVRRGGRRQAVTVPAMNVRRDVRCDRGEHRSGFAQLPLNARSASSPVHRDAPGFDLHLHGRDALKLEHRLNRCAGRHGELRRRGRKGSVVGFVKCHLVYQREARWIARLCWNGSFANAAAPTASSIANPIHFRAVPSATEKFSVHPSALKLLNVPTQSSFCA